MLSVYIPDAQGAGGGNDTERKGEEETRTRRELSRTHTLLISQFSRGATTRRPIKSASLRRHVRDKKAPGDFRLSSG